MKWYNFIGVGILLSPMITSFALMVWNYFKENKKGFYITVGVLVAVILLNMP